MSSSWAASFVRFFKTIIDPSSPILHLPEVISPSIVEILPLKAFVHTPNGETWASNMEYREESVCFSNGWSDFVTFDHIGEAWFVVFTPTAYFSFDVVICGANGLEFSEYGLNPINGIEGASFIVNLSPNVLIRPRLIIPMRFWNMFNKLTIASAIIVHEEKKWEVDINTEVSKISMRKGSESFIGDLGLTASSIIEFKIVDHHPLMFELIIVNSLKTVV